MFHRTVSVALFVLLMSSISNVAKADSPQTTINPNAINTIRNQPEIKAERISFTRIRFGSVRMIRITGTIRNIGVSQTTNQVSQQVALSFTGMPTKYKPITTRLQNNEVVNITMDVPANNFVGNLEFPNKATLIYTYDTDTQVVLDTNFNNNKLERVAE